MVKIAALLRTQLSQMTDGVAMDVFVIMGVYTHVMIAITQVNTHNYWFLQVNAFLIIM